MNEFLHDTEPEISAIAGWEQMQLLLNEHLPAKQPFTYRTSLLPYAAAVILFLCCLLTSLKLENSLFSSIPIYNSHARINDNVGSNNEALKKSAIILGSLGNKKAEIEDGSLAGNWPDFEPGNRNPNSNSQLMLPDPVSGDNKLFVLAEPANIHIEKYPAAEIKPTDHPSLVQKHSSTKKPSNRHWSLLAGIAINSNLKGAQDIQPYATAVARYDLTNRFYLSTGLGLFSATGSRPQGVGKTVHLNDTVNNVRLYNEVISYQRLRYVDIPLSVGAKLTKNISVQAGIQLSVLADKQKATTLDSYDYQMNAVRLPVYAPAFTATTSPQQVYDVEVNKTDYRLIAGAMYSLKKATVALTYQHGLGAVGKGQTVSGERTRQLNLNISFKIK